MLSEKPVYLRCKQITKLLNISRATWHKWVKAGRAPAGKRLGERVTIWDEKDVNAFIESCGGNADKVEAKP
ncbi:MAG: hypothetical protein GQF41_4296 [Candidatus Rifleibacterium amylolyticum]|nr:MAG: hypothetical protein GQF41_4296 [Candidatus Rifleibacterium amylolyticum]